MRLEILLGECLRLIDDAHAQPVATGFRFRQPLEFARGSVQPSGEASIALEMRLAMSRWISTSSISASTSLGISVNDLDFLFPAGARDLRRLRTIRSSRPSWKSGRRFSEKKSASLI